MNAVNCFIRKTANGNNKNKSVVKCILVTNHILKDCDPGRVKQARAGLIITCLILHGQR